jgi:MFS family permease
MLFYAFGMVWLVFAIRPWMIVAGFVLVGLAVGADIPASWSLIAEMAPKGRRGKHNGVAQILWYLGPVVVLLLFLAMAPLGLLFRAPPPTYKVNGRQYEIIAATGGMWAARWRRLFRLCIAQVMKSAVAQQSRFERGHGRARAPSCQMKDLP